MKFKSKYNVGDIVLFYNELIHENDIGTINGLGFQFTVDPYQEIMEYRISPAKIEDSIYDNTIIVREYRVIKKINRKAFEKMFAEKCVKYIAKQPKVKENK